MTIREVANHISAVNIGNWYNREKMPAGWLYTYLKHLMAAGDKIIFEVAMPDGWWFVKVYKHPQGGYDFIIPDTREQEAAIKAEIGW